LLASGDAVRNSRYLDREQLFDGLQKLNNPEVLLGAYGIEVLQRWCFHSNRGAKANSTRVDSLKIHSSNLQLFIYVPHRNAVAG